MLETLFSGQFGLAARHHAHLRSYANSAKTNEANLRKMDKTLFDPIFQAGTFFPPKHQFGPFFTWLPVARLTGY